MWAIVLALKSVGNPAIHWQTAYVYHQHRLGNLGTNVLLVLYGGRLVISIFLLLASCRQNDECSHCY